MNMICSSLVARKFSSKVARNVVIVDGVRIPFTTGGSTYSNHLAVDLGRLALKGLLVKTALDPELIDYLYYGTVIQESKTSNIAREAGMGAGIPVSVPAHTVTQACISANQAITTGAEKILAGQADIIVAGGCETFSDVPIRFSKQIRQRLLQLPKATKKGPLGAIGLLKGLSLRDLAPEAPAIANYTTGEVMGHSSDRLAAKFGVSRKDQDEFTVQSHLRAAKAHADGLYAKEIVPVDGKTQENGIKPDTSYEKVAKLSPAFIKPHGTHTAANSSFLTDGASAVLVMSEEKALALGYKPLAYLRQWTYVGVDPFEELLLGPTFGIQRVLNRSGLSLADVGVIEFHEGAHTALLVMCYRETSSIAVSFYDTAFAGQVLANLTALASPKFAQERFPDGKPVGQVDLGRMNTLGGSLSLGHPFGATGGRLVTTASNRLQREEQRFALIAACADGGLATACLLERYDNK